MPNGSGLDLLRHFLATLAYRTQTALRDAPEGFLEFSPGEGSRSPAEILAHMTDLIRGSARALSDGPQQELERAPSEAEVVRFHSALSALNHTLSALPPDQETARRLLQGPLSDAMTHVGQLALLRRLQGDPVAAEAFVDADIRIEPVNSEGPPRMPSTPA